MPELMINNQGFKNCIAQFEKCYLCQPKIRNMFEGIKRYFRKRFISKYIQHKVGSVLPDLNKFPTITVLIDSTQMGDCKSIEAALNRCFKTKRGSIVVFSEKNEFPPVESFACVMPNDFDVFGHLKADKAALIDSMSSDVFINCHRIQSDVFETDYLAAYFKSPFKITFCQRPFEKMYDLFIDTKRDQDVVSQLDVLSKYLKVLNGYEK